MLFWSLIVIFLMCLWLIVMLKKMCGSGDIVFVLVFGVIEFCVCVVLMCVWCVVIVVMSDML